ncbi:MAG: patatin-like phospholipase family protein, partial [Planctomycetota bacterium]
MLGVETEAEMIEGTVEGAIISAMTATATKGRGPDARRNIAVLSGGGEFGAYGAGFFESYLANSGEGVVFDIVTGVSTGALQSTAIFLGEEEDLGGLVEAYSISRETDLATRRRSIGGLPLETSFYSLDPARARFVDYLSDERIARVAEKAREGRKLLAGVVEVQDGQFYAFDLTAIAASGRPTEEIRRCYTEAVFASAAVPVVFPPVLLDDRQYFDGGVRAAVFLDTAVKALSAMSDVHAKDARVYVLFNGYLDTPATDELAVG